MLDHWMTMDDEERVLIGFYWLFLGLALLYLLNSAVEGVRLFKQRRKIAATRYRRHKDGSMRNPGGYDMDGYGPVEDDGHAYDRKGLDRYGINREGRDEYGYGRDGFSDLGYYRMTNHRYSADTGLDMDGCDLNGHMPASDAEQATALTLYQEAVNARQVTRLLKLTPEGLPLPARLPDSPRTSG